MKFLALIMVVLFFLPQPVRAYEYSGLEGFSEGLIPIDAVLVLDVSRSMRTADPGRISRDAMNLFIEKLDEGRDRIGVVAYAGQVERSRAMTTIRGQEDRESFRYFINELDYASWTDHGLGLMEAVRIMYDSHEEGRQPVIILLTDGNLNVNPSSPRSNAIAQIDVELAIAIAQEQGYPIYTIGLNFDGNLDIDYIRNIADATGGLTFETANAEDLPDIISAIFAAMVPLPPPELVEEEIIIEAPSPAPIIEATPPPEIFPQAPESPPPIEKPLPYYYEQNGRLWVYAGSGLGLLMLAILIWRTNQSPGRVFTGRLALEVIDSNTRTAEPTRYRNLIEYGKRTTLHRLIGSETNHALDSVKLLPCPNAPSHLPKLQFKCKNPRIKFTKDFMAQDASKGVSISVGSEITAEFDNMQVRLRYIM